MPQQDNNNNIEYNDFKGYFDELASNEPLKNKENVKLFKSLEISIEELYQISADQEIATMRKDGLICEIAQTLEQIYINSKLDHLIETIASSICHIVIKKSKTITPRYIYLVLQKRFKDRYTRGNDIMKNDRKLDIFSKLNVIVNDTLEEIQLTEQKVNDMNNIISDIDSNKIIPLKMSIAKLNDCCEKFIESYEDKMSYYRGNNTSGNNQTLLPEERKNNNNSNNTRNEPIFDSLNFGNKPQFFESNYYKKLGEYIDLLIKIRQNVLEFPPSLELDLKLTESLDLEMQLLIPSSDMKFKRSIPQLDETVKYAENQAFNAASSVMSEKSLIKTNQGNIEDPRNRFNKFVEQVHKITPDQIDARKGYISILRKKMKDYNPHLFWHTIWYEGSSEFNHVLSMGKFARGNSLYKEMNK